MAWWASRAAPICKRPALCTQTNSTSGVVLTDGRHRCGGGGRPLQSTTNPADWAAGDSADTEGMPLTPVTVSEAKIAASNMIKGTTMTPDYAGIPTALHHP